MQSIIAGNYSKHTKKKTLRKQVNCVLNIFWEGRELGVVVDERHHRAHPPFKPTGRICCLCLGELM